MISLRPIIRKKTRYPKWARGKKVALALKRKLHSCQFHDQVTKKGSLFGDGLASIFIVDCLFTIVWFHFLPSGRNFFHLYDFAELPPPLYWVEKGGQGVFWCSIFSFFSILNSRFCFGNRSCRTTRIEKWGLFGSVLRDFISTFVL